MIYSKQFKTNDKAQFSDIEADLEQSVNLIDNIMATENMGTIKRGTAKQYVVVVVFYIQLLIFF